MTVLLVDWLGRGGIAQCTESWAIELRAGGRDVVVVSRTGRELQLASDSVQGESPAQPSTKRRRLASLIDPMRRHEALVRSAVRRIHEVRPTIVVIQNYLAPAIEYRVHQAARSVGAKVVFVVHNDHPHSASSGLTVGLARAISRADVVVTHSAYVANSLVERLGREPLVWPLPAPLGLLKSPPVPSLLPAGPPIALHFGILKRRYKGGAAVLSLAERADPNWRFVLAGVGAPHHDRVLSISRFLTGSELVTLVGQAAVVVLPYVAASQSAAIVLAKLLGAVPVATSVGGIPEQITHGVTGMLISSGGVTLEWEQALERLRDATARERMAAAAKAEAWHDHRRFVEQILTL